MPQAVVKVFRESTEPKPPPPILEWLALLKKTERKAYRKCLAFVQYLEREGFALDRPHRGTLRDGIFELRPTWRGVHYRMLYFFCGQNVACLSHGIKKEGAVPDNEIELAIYRMKLVKLDPEKHTQKWEVPQ